MGGSDVVGFSESEPPRRRSARPQPASGRFRRPVRARDSPEMCDTVHWENCNDKVLVSTGLSSSSKYGGVGIGNLASGTSCSPTGAATASESEHAAQIPNLARHSSARQTDPPLSFPPFPSFDHLPLLLCPSLSLFLNLPLISPPVVPIRATHEGIDTVPFEGGDTV